MPLTVGGVQVEQLMCVSCSSQGGCASVVVTLTVQCPQDLSPYSGTAQGGSGTVRRLSGPAGFNDGCFQVN